HFRRHRRIDAHIAERDALLVAGVVHFGIADITSITPRMVQYLELASAVPATEQSKQKPSALAHRACHHRALHIGVACDNLLVAIILLPRDVAIMAIADQHLPLLPSARDTVSDDFASAVEPSSRAGAPKNIRPSIDRIRQQPMNRIVARGAPLHGPPLTTIDGDRQVNPLLP